MSDDDCETCRGDPMACAALPGLHLCEKATREAATPPDDLSKLGREAVRKPDGGDISATEGVQTRESDSDIVDRLRGLANEPMDIVVADILEEAATAIASLREENFRLAADQCHAGYAGEHGDHRCREIDALRERVRVLEGALAIYANEKVWRQHTFVDMESPSFDGWGPAKAALAIPVEQSALTKQEA
jgi:hypothetical protein